MRRLPALAVTLALLAAALLAADLPAQLGGMYGGRQGGGRGIPPGGKPTYQAVRAGLGWLRTHQDDDGKWDVTHFMKHDRQGQACSGGGNPTRAVHVTSLALLAFLADSDLPKAGEDDHPVARAVAWLVGQQTDSGRVGRGAPPDDALIGHAIATLALCEAYGMTADAGLKDPAQSAVDYLWGSRGPAGVWGSAPGAPESTSATVWAAQAMKTARWLGLRADRHVFDDVLRWFDRRTATSGAVTDRPKGPGDVAGAGPALSPDALTAGALFDRFLLGQSPRQQPVMNAAARVLLASCPKWDETTGTIDFNYWFFGSYAIYQMGGRYWKDWSRRLTTALVKTQRADGNYTGSWDPVGLWGKEGGRVHSTAMGVLALQTYYRYTRLVR